MGYGTKKYLDASQTYVISHLHNVHRHLASLLRAQIKKLDWTKEDGSALLSEEVEVACSPIFFLRLRALSRSYLNFQDPTSSWHERAGKEAKREKSDSPTTISLHG